MIAILRYGVCYALRPKLPAELYISLVATLFPTRDRDSDQHKRGIPPFSETVSGVEFHAVDFPQATVHVDIWKPLHRAVAAGRAPDTDQS